MIPVRLSLRNFMPYRDNVPPLYFNGIHTASIWGENGNGKSSLIDAMTWALWGRTRAKSDDEIIHLGQTETEVEFDFSVNGVLYRVIRKRSLPKTRRGAGQSLLEFQVSNGNGFRSISGNTIAQTEKVIIDILHMDYNTFVNSAYLRQGHADEFTQQPPVKRKEVLAGILGLSRFDRLEDEARELARRQETERAMAENALRDIREELSLRPAHETELRRTEAELLEADRLFSAKEKELAELRQKKELLESKRQQGEQLDRHISESSRTKELLETQLKRLDIRITEYEGLISRRGVIEDGYGKYLETRKLNEDLERKFRLVSALNEKKHRLEVAVMRASQALLNEHSLALNSIEKLEENFRKLPGLREQLQQAQSEAGRLDREDEALKQKSREAKQLLAVITSLKTEKKRSEQEIAAIDEKLNLLSSQPGAKCPLCERELGEEHRNLIEVKYANEKQEKTASLESITSGIRKETSGLDSLESEITLREKSLEKARTAAQNRASLLDRDITEAEKAGSQLEEANDRLAEIERKISSRDYAPEEQDALRKVEYELVSLGYDSAAHERTGREMADLAKYEEPRHRLDEALKNIESEKESFSRTSEMIAGHTKSIEHDSLKRKELDAELKLLPDIALKFTGIEHEHRELDSLRKRAQEAVGRLKGILERSTELEQKARDREEQADRAAREEQIYRDLARAFGKRGIQAWLIEMALPEIEREANKLLGRMTDNRMHVKIETQRETKKGDTIETLDIKISDELGTRNYEMFSGGEAFRIDFAIRIALSRLLARRAGAPLPTLIIDEGFGTQDTSGLEKLKEAIISIQDDFQKILVVTHIEEFRDAFPTRIDVIKTSEGSMIQVN